MSVVKRSLNVGVVGMGNMGVPIARNIGFKSHGAVYLQLHSRTLQKARRVCDDLAVDGAACAMRTHDRYATMTKWCDVLLLTLADVNAARYVLLEHTEALVRNARKGQIIVDHTTVDAETSRECAHEAERRGAYFLDAPMSGSPRACFNAQLLLMVGGPAESFQKLLPIFHMYADNIIHMGDSGSGSSAKIITQALVAAHNAAAAEALTMAHRLGVNDQKKLVQVLDASWGSSTMLRRSAPLLQDLIRNPDKLPPTSTASVDKLLQDLSLLDASLPKRKTLVRNGNGANVAKEEEEDEPFPVLDAALRSLAAASDAGMGDRDIAAAVHYIQAGEAELRRRRVTEKNNKNKNSSNEMEKSMNAHIADYSLGSGGVDLGFGGDMNSTNSDNVNKDQSSSIGGTTTAEKYTEFGEEDFY
ncbi:3-hydroxyisobutyrate dehydrogenase [Trypanosoma melophagium]|uniref:3-hydroxyisobutyrate dehydrogenase n=1 Tax=Trypanosoma melophagium TaxID=715481 RepID=UPI00351A371D|nr:3-hydroxyisobutyrate dehydrogenase [Trypanosoma melophagium]